MRKMFLIISIVLVMLLITSCSGNLNVRIQNMVNDDCICDLNSCRCEEEYSSDYIYLNCNDVEVNSILDVVKNCEYVSVIDGQEWKGQVIEVEKIVEKECPECEIIECPECKVCEECEVCDECSGYYYDCDDECTENCTELCEDYCWSCINDTFIMDECEDCNNECSGMCKDYCDDCYDCSGRCMDECEDCNDECFNMCDDYCEDCYDATG